MDFLSACSLPVVSTAPDNTQIHKFRHKHLRYFVQYYIYSACIIVVWAVPKRNWKLGVRHWPAVFWAIKHTQSALGSNAIPFSRPLISHYMQILSNTCWTEYFILLSEPVIFCFFGCCSCWVWLGYLQVCLFSHSKGDDIHQNVYI